MTDRIICGWRVRSLLPLPETLPWPGPARPFDIEIVRGEVPYELGERNADLPYIEMAPDGRLSINALPFGRFLVTPGRIVVDTDFPPESPEWRACLLGPVLAVMCYLRGALPLHASALRIDGRVIAIAGRSGAGKSTLAAALTCRGHALVTDDICACTMHSGRPLVLPTYPAIKLDLAAVELLGIEPRGLVPIGPDFKKVQVPRPEGFDPTPAPLETVYVIEDAPQDATDAIIPVTGAEGFERLSAEIYRPPIGRLLLAKPMFFAMATQISKHVAVRKLLRRPDMASLKALAETIEEDVGKTG